MFLHFVINMLLQVYELDLYKLVYKQQEVNHIFIVTLLTRIGRNNCLRQDTHPLILQGTSVPIICQHLSRYSADHLWRLNTVLPEA